MAGPNNTYETAQLITSKLLIFAVLTYLLILSAKNYLNNKHNSVVNKHRQNSLMTYKAMVDATDDPGSRGAILIQAASCIFIHKLQVTQREVKVLLSQGGQWLRF